VVMVSFPLDFPFPSPFKFFSYHFSALLLFSQPHWLPSLNQSSEQWPATTVPARLMHREGGDSEFSSCFYFIPTSTIFFSSFFQLNCY
jgi:hypothetical protein